MPSEDLVQLGARLDARIREQLQLRSDAASAALMAVTRQIFAGARSGVTYKRGGRSYVASAPGEPPAIRSGTLAGSWTPYVEVTPQGARFGVQSSGAPYAGFLDPALGSYRTSALAPRPFVQATLDQAEPAIRDAMFGSPWLVGA